MTDNIPSPFPHERYSPIALFYAGEEIDIRKFQLKWYSLSQQLKRTLNNPLAVVEYFHNMITAIAIRFGTTLPRAGILNR